MIAPAEQPETRQRSSQQLSQQPGWSREFQFVISTCHPDGAARDVQQTTDEGLDWSRVFDLSAKHRVLPQLHRWVSTADQTSCPAAIREQLKLRMRRLVHRNLFLSAELARAFARLQQAGIECLTFKGPTLAKLAYGDISNRTFDDIDILVSFDDFLATQKCLTELGYHSFENLTLDQQQFQMRSKGEVLYAHPNGGFIDLHTSLSRGTYGYKVTWRGLWANRQTVGFQSATLHTFGMNDLCLYLAIHGAKHRWQRLNWILDFAQAMRLAELSEVMEAAESLGEPKVMQLARLINDATFESEQLGGIDRATVPDRNHARLLAECQHHLEGATVPANRYADLMYLARARQRPLSVIGATLAEIFTPHLTDWNAVRLPRCLWFCYVIVRPVRLLLKRLGIARRAAE